MGFLYGIILLLEVKKMIYLDYAASTPVDKEVLDLFYDTTLKYYANPNSNHLFGNECKNLIDESTKKIADMLGVRSDEIIYTSGATESNNLAIKGIAHRYKNFGKHIILSSLEHNSIINTATTLTQEGFEVDLLNVLPNGLVDVNQLKNLIRDDTILVSICSVDSELGLVQPIKEIGDILSNYPNIYFHTDASQAIGKVNIDFSNVDLVTIAPHKFYGLNGIGILIKKSNVGLVPIINGGKSTTVYRSGTPDLASIVATSKSLEIAINNLNDRYTYVKNINNIIINKLKEYKCIHINNTDLSIPYTINFSIKGIKSDIVVNMFGNNNIYVSTKTSCCPVSTPSKLVYALTKDKSLASTSIRVSISHLTTMEEVMKFLSVLDAYIKELESNGKI
jgi:cysteine desulfurase